MLPFRSFAYYYYFFMIIITIIVIIIIILFRQCRKSHLIHSTYSVYSFKYSEQCNNINAFRYLSFTKHFTISIQKYSNQKNKTNKNFEKNVYPVVIIVVVALSFIFLIFLKPVLGTFSYFCIVVFLAYTFVHEEILLL